MPVVGWQSSAIAIRYPAFEMNGSLLMSPALKNEVHRNLLLGRPGKVDPVCKTKKRSPSTPFFPA